MYTSPAKIDRAIDIYQHNHMSHINHEILHPNKLLEKILLDDLKKLFHIIIRLYLVPNTNPTIPIVWRNGR
jgi:hypothetical protein